MTAEACIALSGAGWALGGEVVPITQADEPAVPVSFVERLRGQRVRVTVDASWARLFVLPHSDRLDRESAWAPYAQARFEQLFGEPCEGWALQWLAEPPPHPRLAAALPQTLLASLRHAFGRRVASVRIGAVSRLQALRARNPRFCGVLCEWAPQHLLVTLLVAGRPQRVRLRRGAPDLLALVSVVRAEWAGLGDRAPLQHVALSGAPPFDAAETDTLRALAPQVLRLQ